MPKIAGTKTNDFEPAHVTLRRTCFKLRGLAYLIERCGDDSCTPLDLDDVFYGVGLMLTQLQTEVVDVARAFERQELKKS